MREGWSKLRERGKVKVLKAGRELKILNFDKPVINSEHFSTAYSRQPLLIDICAFEMKNYLVCIFGVRYLSG